MLSLSSYHSCVKEQQKILPEGHRCPRLALRARAVAEGFAARSGEAEEEAEQTQDFCRVLVEVGGDMWVGVCSWLVFFSLFFCYVPKMLFGLLLFRGFG